MQSFRPKGWELNGAISSVGRALDCGSRCRGFEPHIAPQDGRNAVFFVLRRTALVARSKVRPRTGTKNTRRYCWLAGLPQIHFGREDSVERTLLRIACQGETFSAPPWQGGIDIRAIWHIGCQSEFDKLRKCLPVR